MREHFGCSEVFSPSVHRLYLLPHLLLLCFLLVLSLVLLLLDGAARRTRAKGRKRLPFRAFRSRRDTFLRIAAAECPAAAAADTTAALQAANTPTTNVHNFLTANTGSRCCSEKAAAAASEATKLLTAVTPGGVVENAAAPQVEAAPEGAA